MTTQKILLPPRPTEVSHETLEARVSAHAARARYWIIRSAIDAKRSLCLSASAEEAEAAEMLETIRTFAVAIVLEGQVRFPVYDEQPWIATFLSPRQLRLALPHLTATEVRRTVTAAFLRRAERKWRAQSGRNRYLEDRFVILDEFDRPVLIGKLRRERDKRRCGRSRLYVEWIPTVDSSQIQGLKERAEQCDRLGSEEHGWDNFSTARGLWQQASELRESASCAQYGNLLFQ